MRIAQFVSCLWPLFQPHFEAKLTEVNLLNLKKISKVKLNSNIIEKEINKEGLLFIKEKSPIRMNN